MWILQYVEHIFAVLGFIAVATVMLLIGFLYVIFSKG